MISSTFFTFYMIILSTTLTHGFRLTTATIARRSVAIRPSQRFFCQPTPAPTSTSTSTTPAAGTPSTASGANNSDLSCLEIRIGKILEISVHPEAENLYVEKVDIGTLIRCLCLCLHGIIRIEMFIVIITYC